MELSASCMLYLFADEVVKKATLWSRLDGQHSVAVPCGRPPVQLGPLERSMLAWALWGLRERGLIELLPKPGAPKYLDITRLVVDTDAPGLDGELLDCCRESPEGISVVIARWAQGRGKPLPLDAVIATAQDEAMSREILIDATPRRSRLRDRFSSRDHQLFAEPDCRRIAALASDFQELLDLWTYSVEVEGLGDALIQQCRDALRVLRPVGAPDYS